MTFTEQLGRALADFLQLTFPTCSVTYVDQLQNVSIQTWTFITFKSTEVSLIEVEWGNYCQRWVQFLLTANTVYSVLPDQHREYCDPNLIPWLIAIIHEATGIPPVQVDA